MNKQITIIIAIIVTLVTAFILFRGVSTGTPPSDEPETLDVATSTNAMLSFVILPSSSDGNWLTYSKGAVAEVRSDAPLAQVVIKAMPTGAGAGEEFPNGTVIAEATKVDTTNGRELWKVVMPPDVLATNVWAEATDLNGKLIKSPDLGNIGYQE